MLEVDMLRVKGEPAGDDPILTMEKDSAGRWWLCQGGQPARKASLLDMLANVADHPVDPTWRPPED